MRDADRALRDAWGEGITVTHVDGPRLHSTTISNGRGDVLFRCEGPSMAERVDRAIASAAEALR